ncbi:tetratricopeptide repeat protein [Corallibacter vietnamensis]|uniref:Tetratricopeptide repeat protein n=1 Tax=Corallibacter vietnamensis TaxID=904130 RepID=A0ABP7GVY9_9FLAO
MKKIIYILFAVITFSVNAQKNSVLFEQGNTLYNNGNYKDAISKYEEIIKNGEHSSALYYNLGNAHYKLNNIAPSIYYFEKALQLSPNDQEIKNNIAFARNMTIDAIDTVPEVGFSKSINSISGTMNFDGWAITSIVCVVLFVVLFIGYYFVYNTSRKRILFISGMGFLIFAGIALGLAFHQENLVNNNNPAIVFAKESQVKSEPNLRSAEAFKLHEGTKVQILDTVNNWKKIKLSDGKSGWIPSQDIKAL